MKQLGNGDNADSERVGGAEAEEAPPRRSSRERATQKTTRQWNPITKEYEQVKPTLTAASTGSAGSNVVNIVEAKLAPGETRID